MVKSIAVYRRSGSTYPSASEVVKYDYNSRGFLESIHDGANVAIADFAFDDAGRMTKKTLPNGLDAVYQLREIYFRDCKQAISVSCK